MICKKCKKENVNYAKFCMYCGYQLKKIHIFRYIFLFIIFIFLSIYLLKLYRESYTYSDIKIKEKVVFDYKKSDIDFKETDMPYDVIPWIIDIRVAVVPLGITWRMNYVKGFIDYNISYNKDNKIDYHFIGEFPVDNKTKLINLFLRNKLINMGIKRISDSFFIGDDYYVFNFYSNKLNGHSRDLLKNFRIIEKDTDGYNVFEWNSKNYCMIRDENNIYHFYENLKKVSDGNNVNKAFYSELHDEILLIYDNYIKTLSGKKLTDIKYSKKYRNDFYLKKILEKKYNQKYSFIKYGSFISENNTTFKRFNEYKSQDNNYICVCYGGYVFFNERSMKEFSIIDLKYRGGFYHNEDSFILINPDISNLLKNFKYYNTPENLEYLQKEVSNDLNNIFYYTQDRDYKKEYKAYIYSLKNEGVLTKLKSPNGSDIFKTSNAVLDNGTVDTFDVEKYRKSDFIILFRDKHYRTRVYINDEMIYMDKNNKYAEFEIVDGDNYGIYFRSTYNVMDQWYYFINGKKEKNSFKEIEKLKFNNKNDYIYSAKIKDKWHFVLNGEIIERGYDFINYVKYIEEKDSFYAFACDDDKLYLVEIPIKRNNKVTKK